MKKRAAESISSFSWIVLVLFFAAAYGLSAENRSPSLFAANAVREALKEHGVAPQMTTTSRTPREARDVVSSHLDPRLLKQTQSVSGRDFRYHFAESTRVSHLGVIVLQYPTDALAKQMAALLTNRQNYFRSTKILTRFSAVPLGRLLVMTYSENSGDDRIVGVIDNLPTSFTKTSEIGSPQWDEPESTSAPK